VFEMKGVFWNSNGFRDPKKHRFVSDLRKEHQLSFIMISKTGRKNFHDAVLRNLCGVGISCGIVNNPEAGREAPC
jgi:hypothetical protein